MEPIIQQVYLCVLTGEHKEVVNKVKTAIKHGLSPSTIMNDGMISAIAEVGLLFEKGEYFIPEMLVAARAMQAGMNVLKPYLAESEVHPAGKVVIGTVKGDFHDIGKNLVKMMLEGSGFEVIDLGVDVDPELFLSYLGEHGANILAMSALITTTMQAMQPVISMIEKSGIRHQVKIIVGGAPLSEEYAYSIGADGYAPDASRAVRLVKSLLKE